MTKHNPPFFEFFCALRNSQPFSLGIEDYYVLIEALQGGFGINSEEGKFDKEQLFSLCQTLWLKPNQSFYIFKEVFEKNYALIPQEDTTENPISDSNEDPNTTYNEPAPPKNNPTPSPQNDSSKEKETDKENAYSDTTSPNPIEAQKSSQNHTQNLPEIIRFQVTVGENQAEKGSTKEENKPKKSRIFLLSDDYYPLDSRKVQQTLRNLPLKRKTQAQQHIDFEATAMAFAQKGYFETLHYQKEKQIINQILFLTDHQGSMAAFDSLQKMLKNALTAAFSEYNQAETKVSHFYFYNVPQEYVYKNYAHTEYSDIPKLVQTYQSPQTILLILSDAGAARGSNSSARVRATIRALFRLQSITAKIVWLNPMPEDRWKNTSAERIARFVPMYEANEAGLHNAVKMLKGKMYLSNND